MGTKIDLPPGGKPIRAEPNLVARLGKPWRRVLSGAALLAYGASHVLGTGPIVWSDPGALMGNAAFLKLVAFGLMGLVVLSGTLAPRVQLTPIKELKRRELWGKGIAAAVVSMIVAELWPAPPPLGLELRVGDVDIRAINDEQLAAAVVVLSDLRILNARSRSVDLTFSADVISRGSNDAGVGFSAVTDCSNANGTVLAERLEALGLGGYMRTPLNIGGGSPVEGRLCLWRAGDYAAPFDSDFILHIRDGVTQDLSSVEMDEAGGSYEARVLPQRDDETVVRVVEANR